MTNPADDPAQARRYWDAWSQALQHGAAAGPAAPAAATASPDWSQALGWWRNVLGDAMPADARAPVGMASGPAADWLGLMQGVAGRFAGRDSNSADVAGAWREAVQGQGDGILQWVLGSLRGGVAGGFDPWLQQSAQLLEQWQRDSAPWLDMPAFGVTRNHQSRWQALTRLQQDYQARSQAYLEQLRAALEQAFGRFESKLSEHEALGSQLTSARAMFDLWIEAAEEAYSAIALSDEFGAVYGDFANAHMRLRAALQGEVEQIASQYGMPTRSEMDAAHKRIAELERAVRRLVAAAGKPTGETPREPARKAADKPAQTAKSAAAKKAVKVTPAKKSTRPARPAARPVAKKTPTSAARPARKSK